MLLLPRRVRTWWTRGQDAVAGDLDLIYQRCVDACLEVPRTARLLGQRPQATASAVRERMAAGPDRERALARARASQADFDAAAERLEGRDERAERAVSECSWNWQLTCAGLAASASVLVAVCGTKYGFRVLGALIVLGWLLSRWADWPRVLHRCLKAGWNKALWVIARCDLGYEAARWGERVQRGIEPVVHTTTRRLLGEDPDSLLLTETTVGLRAARSPRYVVESTAMQQLKRKMSQIDGGTIAVCGPRGAGKSTLLENAVARAGFGVLAQAPATYAPHDFLLSLSVDLSEKYIHHHGYPVPTFTRLSHTRRVLHQARVRLARLVKWSVFALPAAAALTIGLGPSLRATVSAAMPGLMHRAHVLLDQLATPVLAAWHGQTAGASISLALLGLAWFRARRIVWLRHAASRIWSVGATLAAMALAFGSTIGFLEDPVTNQRLQEIPPGVFWHILGYFTVWTALSVARNSGHEIHIRTWSLRSEDLFGPLATLTGVAVFLYALTTPATLALVAAPDNLLRLACLITGLVLMRLRFWRPRPAEPPLVTRCRNHLFRLQTQQTTTAALNTTASQILGVGTSHTTSVATMPPNYPEVVQDFKDLLTDIAADLHRQDKSVVIAIDEVDRLGTDAQALAFLSEIKAVFGVDHVHYLISVAEDVGAAFVRRGLPHRDATDSSIDDALHVQPATLEESSYILNKRAAGLSHPYVMLAHALSGGIPRDLIRYARRILDMKDATESNELVDIARRLILEELAETLAGFRTLLAKQTWTEHNSAVLTRFRTLTAQLRNHCSCNYELHEALQEFAAPPPDRPHTQDITDDVKHMIDEASAYAYYSLTLLDIFGTDALTHRMNHAATRGPHGDPQLLAEARQELAISPHSARLLATQIRTAWSLPRRPLERHVIASPRCHVCRVPTSLGTRTARGGVFA